MRHLFLLILLLVPSVCLSFDQEEFERTIKRRIVVSENCVLYELKKKGKNFLREKTNNPFFTAEINYQKAFSAMKKGDYQDALELFSKIDKSKTPRFYSIESYKIFCHAQDDPVRGIRLFKNFLNTCDDSPERYKEFAIRSIRELRGEGTGPLLEISKAMTNVERLLRKRKTGFNPTGKRQKEIVQELDRLIDLLENKKKGQKSKNKKNKSKRNKNRKGSGGNGKDKSDLPNNMREEIEKALRGKTPEQKEFWGKLKDLERSDILDIYREKFPGQYDKLIRQYFKEMSDKSTPTETNKVQKD